MNEDLLTADQAAARLGLSPKTVRRQLRDGLLPGIKLGTGPKAQWRLPAAYIDHRSRVDAHEERMTRFRAAGGVVGREGTLLPEIERIHGSATAEAVEAATA